MKSLKYVVLIFVFVVSGFVLFAKPAKAYSPVIASCNSNVNNHNSWTDIKSNQVRQLFEVRDDQLMLDGVSARLYAAGSENAEVIVQVKSRDGQQISAVRGGITIGPTPAWYYFDLPDVALPRATYWLEIGSYTGDPLWNFTDNGACVADSYAWVNGGAIQEDDMGFAVYAYAQTGSSGSNTNSSSSGTGTAGSSSGSGSQNSSSTGQSTIPGSSSSSTGSNGGSGSSGLTDKEILDMTGDSGGMTFWEKIGTVFGSFAMSGILSLIEFVLFFGFIALIIILIVRASRKKKPVATMPAPAAAPAPTAAPEPPKPAETAKPAEPKK